MSIILIPTRPELELQPSTSALRTVRWGLYDPNFSPMLDNEPEAPTRRLRKSGEWASGFQGWKRTIVLLELVLGGPRILKNNTISR